MAKRRSANDLGDASVTEREIPEGERDRPRGRIARWAEHPAGPVVLFAFAVLEGCLFPAPTEAMLAALALARPRRSAWLVGVATAGSVLGGLAGYALGALFYDSAGRALLERNGLLGQADALGAAYRDHLALALLTSGYTPIPYLLYGILAGALGVPLLPFVALSAVGRGLKYALLGVLTRWLGPLLRAVWERHPRWLAVTAVAIAAAVAAWYALG